MKGLQQKFGYDKVAVLILNVDGGDEFSKPIALMKFARKAMKEQGVDFPMVLLPNGWEDASNTFHLDGYGLTMIGPDGKVRAIDKHTEELEKLIPTVI